jgi:hypothetical protein
MKIPRALIGRPVRVVWADPCSFDADEVPRGRAGLALWEEYGVITDVQEGVVSFFHAKVTSSDTKPRYQGSAVPEELVESVEELMVKPREGA